MNQQGQVEKTRYYSRNSGSRRSRENGVSQPCLSEMVEGNGKFNTGVTVVDDAVMGSEV